MIFTSEIVMIVATQREKQTVNNSVYKAAEGIRLKEKRHVISRVLPGSIAEELELEPGDILAAINGQPVEDVFDYRYLMNDEYVTLLVEKADGELWELEV